MTKFKGTQGEWKVCERTNHVQAAPSAGREIRMIQTICSVNSTFISDEQFKANQLLISKAPKMLEMLKNVHEAYKMGEFEYCQFDFDELELIIKSTTETP